MLLRAHVPNATALLLVAAVAIALDGASLRAHAHVAAWARGMYCQDGNDGTINQNTIAAVNPVFNLTQADWWFQHDRKCDAFPPKAGDFLELPAGGAFAVEFGTNRAFTSLSYDGSKTTEWPTGDAELRAEGSEGCFGPMHTDSEANAAGSAFAISYQSSLQDVTMDNLVVFTTLAHSPWRRKASFQVPARLPACPEAGCTCAWLWVPKGCGQPNVYMQGFKCKVTGATSTAKLARAKAPVYCKYDASACVKGAKQMIAWNQLTGNNVVVPPGASPAYNALCGFADGAQNDIFEEAAAADAEKTTSSAPTVTTAPPVAPVEPSPAPAPSTAAPIVAPAVPSSAPVPSQPSAPSWGGRRRRRWRGQQRAGPDMIVQAGSETYTADELDESD